MDSDSRVDLLENKVVLCVPENADKGVDSFDSLAEHLKAEDILFCMGNSDVPVGQYTQKILAYYELDEAASGCGRLSSPTAPTSRKSPLKSARPAWMPVSSTAPMPSAPV